jgi:VanZ family protein
MVLGLILVPGRQMPDFGDLFSFDKFAHLGVFAVLMLLMVIGFTKQSRFKWLQKNAVYFAMFSSLTYGLLLELGQSLIAGRDTNIFDLAFNSMGVMVGGLLYFLIYKFSLA